MDNAFLIMATGIVLALIVTGVFYESLCQISRVISKTGVKPRLHMYIMITGILIAHALAITVYAAAFWGLVHYAGFAGLAGNVAANFQDYLYFSVTSYTSLGLGDIYPLGRITAFKRGLRR